MAAKETAEQPLVVLQSFVGNVNGIDVGFRQGDSIKSSHPAVKKWPQFFGPQAVRHESPKVEQATAAPGEMRS